MKVETSHPNGQDVWVLDLVGQRSEQFRRGTLISDDLPNLTIADSLLSYEGYGRLVEFEVFEPKAENEVHRDNVTRAKATCLCYSTVLSRAGAARDAKGQHERYLR